MIGSPSRFVCALIVAKATKIRITHIVAFETICFGSFADATIFWHSKVMKKLDDLRNSTWRLFLTAHIKLLDRIEGKLKEADLPPLEWYDVLWALKEAPDHRLRLSELADKALLSRSNLTRLVDRLEAAELLQRERCPSDRRGAFAVLTEAGLAMQQAMWIIYAQGISQYFGRYLSDTDAEALMQAFSTMLAAVNNSESSDSSG
jgi:DNA-binding MarR family transcriptional regulator